MTSTTQLGEAFQAKLLRFPSQTYFDASVLRTVLDQISDGVYVVDLQRRIVLWNRAAERLTGFVGQEVIGRFCADGILRHCDASGSVMCGSRCPLQATMADGQEREVEVFMTHKSGHRVPVRVTSAALLDDSGRVVGSVETFTDTTPRLAVLDEIRQLRSAAMVDPLTAIGNRRFLESQIRSLVQQMTGLGWPFALFFVDIDHFKSINDRFGHDTGDRALRAVAETMAGSLRSFDFTGRWGGEEFLVVALNVNHVFVAQLAERLRALVAATRVPLPDGGELELTISLGATIARPGESADELIARADRLMYRSKSEGRDRVSIG